MHIDERILKARTALIMSQPFFGALAMRLVVKERSDIKTMATDGTYLYYCRAFLDWCSAADLIFVIAHEVLHCALSHMTRRGNRRWDLWQAATDHVVNLMLQEAGFNIPEWVKYCDPRFKGLGVEEVYAILENEEPKEPQQDDEEQDDDQNQGQDQEEDQPQGSGQDEEDEDGQEAEDGDDQGQDDQNDTDSGDSGDSPDTDEDTEDGSGGDSQDGDAEEDGTGSGEDQSEQEEAGQGSGSSGKGEQDNGKPSPSYGDPGGCGEVLDAAPPHDQNKLDDVASEWQVYTRQAANIARRAGEGRAPGFIEEIVEELNTPQTNWRDTFRRFVDPMTSTKDYSWTKPSVRQMTMGFYVPGFISDGINHVALIIDDSASIDTDWLKQFGGESQAALDDGAVDKVTLIFIDTEVRRTAEYVRGELIDFTCTGRGGTRFSPAFEWLKENAPDVSLAVYFTDLDCSDYGEEPAFPVMWAAYDSDPIRLHRNMAKVPFGEIVELRR